jgi:hypothetical protein
MFLFKEETFVKKLALNSMVIVLALLVFITTSGFTVHRHTCSQAHTTELSFLIEKFSCEHHTNGHEAGQSCCGIAHEEENTVCGTTECCNTESFLLKLDLPFQMQDNVKLMAYQVVIQSFRITLDEELKATEQSFILIGNDLPPPLSGRKLLISLHQLNIPPFMV